MTGGRPTYRADAVEQRKVTQVSAPSFSRALMSNTSHQTVARKSTGGKVPLANRLAAQAAAPARLLALVKVEETDERAAKPEDASRGGSYDEDGRPIFWWSPSFGKGCECQCGCPYCPVAQKAAKKAAGAVKKEAQEEEEKKVVKQEEEDANLDASDVEILS